MTYYLKNEEIIKGPIGDAIVELAIKNGKISSSTQLSTSKSGPWQTISEVFPDASLDLGDLDLSGSSAVSAGGSLHYANQLRQTRVPEKQPRMSKAQQKKLQEKKNKTYLLFGGIGVVAVCFMIALPLFLVLVLGGNAAAKKEQDRQRERGKPPSQEALAKREQFRNGVQNMASGINNRDGDQVATGAQQIRTATSNGIRVKRVKVEIGDITITDDRSGISHVKIACNNGNVIEADWERNSFNDFGYDVYKPTVTMDTNRLAVMVIVRKVIVNYLDGNY